MGDEQVSMEQAAQAEVVRQQSELISALELALADAENRASVVVDGARWEAKARRLEKQLDALRKASEDTARRNQEQLLAAELLAPNGSVGEAKGSDEILQKLLDAHTELEQERMALGKTCAELQQRDEDLRRVIDQKREAEERIADNEIRAQRALDSEEKARAALAEAERSARLVEERLTAQLRSEEEARKRSDEDAVRARSEVAHSEGQALRLAHAATADAERQCVEVRAAADEERRRLEADKAKVDALVQSLKAEKAKAEEATRAEMKRAEEATADKLKTEATIGTLEADKARTESAMHALEAEKKQAQETLALERELFAEEKRRLETERHSQNEARHVIAVPAPTVVHERDMSEEWKADKKRVEEALSKAEAAMRTLEADKKRVEEALVEEKLKTEITIRTLEADKKRVEEALAAYKSKDAYASEVERVRREALEADVVALKERLNAADKQYLEALSLVEEQRIKIAKISPASVVADDDAPKAPSAEESARLIEILREQVRVLQQQVRVLRSSGALDEERLQELRLELEGAQHDAMEAASEATRSTTLLQTALLSSRREAAAAQEQAHKAVTEAYASREMLAKAEEARAQAERTGTENSNAAAEMLVAMEAMRDAHRTEVARMQQAQADVQLQLLDQAQMEEASRAATQLAQCLEAEQASDRAVLRSLMSAMDVAKAELMRTEGELAAAQEALTAERVARTDTNEALEAAQRESLRLRETLERTVSAKTAAEKDALQRELDLIDTLEAQLRDLRLLYDSGAVMNANGNGNHAARAALPLPLPSSVAHHHDSSLPPHVPFSSHSAQLRTQHTGLAVSVPPYAPAPHAMNIHAPALATRVAYPKRQVLTALSEERRALAQARQKLVDELWSRSVSLLPSRKPREYAFLTPMSTPSK